MICNTTRTIIFLFVFIFSLEIVITEAWPVHSIETSVKSTSDINNSFKSKDSLFADTKIIAQKYIVKGKAGLIEKDGTIIIRSEDQSSQIVYIDESTKITRNGKIATLSELKSGDQVQAVVGSNRRALEFNATGP